MKHPAQLPCHLTAQLNQTGRGGGYIANDYRVKPLNKVYTHWKCPLFSIPPFFRGNNNYTDYLMY